MGRVVVYLDVDGVISALSSKHAFRDARQYTVDGFQLTLSRALGTRLRGLDAELRWLTTWAEEANRVGALIGLPALDVAAHPPPGATASGPWKWEALRQVVELEGRPFVWVDDDAIGPDADAWAAQSPGQALLIRPRGNRGLSPAELDEIEEFIARVQEK